MAGDALGRLRKGREFDRVYAEGTVVGGPLFVVRALANDGEAARWGFAVGKKLAPGAVVRNRVRRRLREAARLVGTFGSFDVVVTARPGVLGADFGRITSELRRSLSRLESVK